MRILVTGAAGFIGTALCRRLVEDEHEVVACGRSRPELPGILFVPSPELGPEADWAAALDGAEIVVHLAARAHFVGEKDGHETEALYHRVNTEGTLNLARQAADAGVRRSVFLSTIGVNGNSILHGKVFTPTDTPSPHDPYSMSKYEAEIGLHSIAQSTGMEVVIIRPPLVYGANAPGNFGKLTRLVAKSFPLPLGSINNLRSFVGIDNLVDFIVTCLEHPDAANETFLVSDGEDLSTPDLIRRMARAMNRPARLMPVPMWALKAAALLLGKGDAVQRLCGNLQVDISKSRTLLGWNPPISVDEGLRRAVGGG